MPDSGVFRKRTIKRQALGPPEARWALALGREGPGRGGWWPGPGDRPAARPPAAAGGWRPRAPLAHGLGCRVTVTAGPQEDELRRARPRSKRTALRSWVARGRPHQAPQTGRLQRWKSTVPVWRPEVGDQGGGGRLLSWLLAGGSLATSSSLAGVASPRPLPRACVRVQMSPLYKGSSHVGLRAHPAPARPRRN